jgi:beta-glucosidase/6-phospho-beta-glucosidase/beta-galactosidase
MLLNGNGFSHMCKPYPILFRHERLKFWSDPDTELKLAKETGISVFRLGIDWTRVMPKEPTEDSKGSVSL